MKKIIYLLCVFIIILVFLYSMTTDSSVLLHGLTGITFFLLTSIYFLKNSAGKNILFIVSILSILISIVCITYLIETYNLNFSNHNLLLLYFTISIIFLSSILLSTDSINKIQDIKNTQENDCKNKLLDTSVIIDGRIVDLYDINFIEGTILIPQFILKELQAIADSSDMLKRNRGRRGLDVLQKLQDNKNNSVAIIDNDYPEIKDIDSKLVKCATDIGAWVITNDFNLNKVATLQKVTVLNINELANALKPVIIPGEQIKVKILKEGKENNQGVAYLNDGTMIVVDNTKHLINQNVEAIVTSTIQTSAGRMIFAKLPKDL